MKNCPTCGGSGQVPDDYVPSATRPGIRGGAEPGGTCHCDGPPHLWDPTWCPPAGPVRGR